MPVVQVKLSDECHKALKQYSAFFGVPMGEALYRFARYAFHKQAHCCKWMSSNLEQLGIELDKGSEKPCSGTDVMAALNRWSAERVSIKDCLNCPQSMST